jgi:hypothetical protein
MSAFALIMAEELRRVRPFFSGMSCGFCLSIKGHNKVEDRIERGPELGPNEDTKISEKDFVSVGQKS